LSIYSTSKFTLSHVQLNVLWLTELLEAAWTVQISQHKTKLGGYLLTAVYINHNALAT